MESNSFRSSLFGGFSRKDVVDYIEKSAAAANERIEVLEARCNQLSHENEGLRADLDITAEARDRLDEKLSDALAHSAQLKDALDEANAKLTALSEQHDALADERAQLREELTQLRPKAEQFAAMKANIAELELAARRRANQYEAETRLRADTYASETAEQVDTMLNNCRAQCDQILAMLDEACTNVTAELQKTAASVTRLPIAFHTLRHEMAELGQAERSEDCHV